MPVLDEVLAANEEYAASFGAKSELAMPPARAFAILTCMDARLDPAKYAGLAEGDAHVIRNAGRPCERRRDPLARHLLQAARHEGVVRHPPHRVRHGVLHRRDDARAARAEPRDRGARRRGLPRRRQGPGLRARPHTSTGSRSPTASSSVVADVVADSRRTRSCPARIPIYGYVYDVEERQADRGSRGHEIGKAAASRDAARSLRSRRAGPARARRRRSSSPGTAR